MIVVLWVWLWLVIGMIVVVLIFVVMCVLVDYILGFEKFGNFFVGEDFLVLFDEDEEILLFDWGVFDWSVIVLGK